MHAWTSAVLQLLQCCCTTAVHVLPAVPGIHAALVLHQLQRSRAAPQQHSSTAVEQQHMYMYMCTAAVHVALQLTDQHVLHHCRAAPHISVCMYICIYMCICVSINIYIYVIDFATINYSAVFNEKGRKF